MSENITLPLNLTAAAASSRLLADANVTPVVGAGRAADRQRIDEAQAQAVNMHNHQQGIEPATFAASDASVFKSLEDQLADRKGPAVRLGGRGPHAPLRREFPPGEAAVRVGRPGRRPPYECGALACRRGDVAVFANFFVGSAASRRRIRRRPDLWKRLVYHSTTSAGGGAVR